MKYNGLSDKEVIENRNKYGTNEINIERNDSFISLFIETLGDPIIKILLIALGIKIIFLFRDFDWYETVGIVLAILMASLLSSLSEYGSAKAFKRLQTELQRYKCIVRRNSKNTEIYTDEVVYKDIVVLSAGDKIVADGILIDGRVSVNESVISGEVKEKYKIPVKKYPKYDDNNFLYKESVINEGTGIMEVINVGENTYYGKMTKNLSSKDDISVLKLRLTNLAKLISKIGYIASVLVFISYLFNKIVITNHFDIELIKDSITNIPLIFGYILNALTLCITIIIVSVPEGLPVMITLVLSSNMKRMVKDNVLVRKLVGIETAGSLNILFTDKTGTLTKGNHEVIGYTLGNGNNYISLEEVSNTYKKILKLSIIYNNESSYDESNNISIGSNSTDRALLNYVKENKKESIKVIDKVSFTSDNKYSISVIDNGKKLKLVKGAYEIIIDKCSKYIDEEGNIKLLDKSIINNILDSYTKKGIRVIALAIMENNYVINHLKNMILVGTILIKDEVRDGAYSAVKDIKAAGINMVMITGDNVKTAKAISKELGIIEDDNDIILTSSEMSKLSDIKLGNILPHLKVVARALPDDKLRLVNIAKNNNLVVGMTGDGVNDAPSLKKADVSFAMGSGTAVAKEASDIIILDDNIKSIVKSILFGRTTFKSIRKFIICQLTINLTALLISIVGPFIGIAMPVTVIQMLWINMVMDTLAGIAYSYEPPLKEYLKEKPKNKNESIINRYMLITILTSGIFSFILCIFFLKSSIITSYFRKSDEYLLTAFFGLFIFMGVFNIMNARTNRLNIFSNIFKNKIFIFIILFIIITQVLLIYCGGTLFRTRGLLFSEFIFMLILSSLVIPVDMVKKVIFKIIGSNNGV